MPSIVGRIMGKGLIGEVLVVNNDVPVMLISDVTLTEKGTRLIQDDDMLFGVAAGRRRDSTAPRTETEAMWMMNLRQLMMEEDPRDKVNDHDRANDLSARQIVDLIMAQEGSTVNANEVSHRLPPVIPTLLSTHSNQGMGIEGKGPCLSGHRWRAGRPSTVEGEGRLGETCAVGWTRGGSDGTVVGWRW